MEEVREVLHESLELPIKHAALLAQVREAGRSGWMHRAWGSMTSAM